MMSYLLLYMASTTLDSKLEQIIVDYETIQAPERELPHI